MQSPSSCVVFVDNDSETSQTVDLSYRKLIQAKHVYEYFSVNFSRLNTVTGELTTTAITYITTGSLQKAVRSEG
jgi:hypothetical protein